MPQDATVCSAENWNPAVTLVPEGPTIQTLKFLPLPTLPYLFPNAFTQTPFPTEIHSISATTLRFLWHLIQESLDRSKKGYWAGEIQAEVEIQAEAGDQAEVEIQAEAGVQAEAGDQAVAQGQGGAQVDA